MQQDKTGSAECTFKMRLLTCLGLPVFAGTVTLAAIMWMKGLEHEWYSTFIRGLLFCEQHLDDPGHPLHGDRCAPAGGAFEGRDQGEAALFHRLPLFRFHGFLRLRSLCPIFHHLEREHTGGNLYYLQREHGAWWQIGLLIIFGHFFVPFLALLRIDVKLIPAYMFTLTVWAWLMNYADMAFNVLPVARPDGYYLTWVDVACMVFMAGLMLKFWIKSFLAHPPYPQKDPRMSEGLDLYPPITAAVTAGAPKSKMKNENSCCDCSKNTALVLGVLGSCLVVAGLVCVMLKLTNPPSTSQGRTEERLKNLADIQAANSGAIDSYGCRTLRTTFTGCRCPWR